MNRFSPGRFGQHAQYFKGGGSPTPTPVVTPPPPTVEDAEVKAQDTADQLRRRKGRASTILTNDMGSSTTGGAGTSPTIGTKALLGS